MSEAFNFPWSKEAVEGFLRAAAVGGGRFKIKAGLNAAVEADAPMMVAWVLENAIPRLAALNRTLILKADDDGKVRLKLDEDLLRFAFQNHLDPDIDARMVEETTPEELIELLNLNETETDNG